MEYHFILIMVRLIIVFLGLIITILSFKSHRKNRSRTMLLLSIGFALITLSVVTQGVLFEFFGWDVFTVQMVESVGVALAFGLIVYSIYGTKT